MVTARFNRPKLWILALCLMIPMIAEAIVPYYVGEIFRSVGCDIIRAEKVANTELNLDIVYVAWCSGADVYLVVVKCKGLSCRVLR